jgi:hypothetical protein
MRRLWQVLARQWRRMWGGSRGGITAKRDHDTDARRWAEARSRFWTELREGEREAEAQRPRRHP